MGFFPLTFVLEWIMVPGFGFLFLSQKGTMARAWSMMFFILALPMLFGPQFILIDLGTSVTEITMRYYTTDMIRLLFTIHLALIAFAGEMLLGELGRDPIGRKRKPVQQ